MPGVTPAPATLYGWFERTADRLPDAPALEVNGQVLSYAALREQAGRLAAALPATCRRGTRVGLYGARNAATYAAYLAILRRGAAVVPLQPALPATRLAAMCRAAGVQVTVVDPAAAPEPALAAMPGMSVVSAVPDPGAAVPAPRPARPDDLAYILFTSGSTGRPKGVPIRHRQLGRYLPYCVDRFGVGPGSRVSQAFDLSFDPSVHDMFVAWAAGATLVVPQPPELLTPARFVAHRGVTHWFSTPSVISLADRLRGLPPGCMPALRWSLFAGDQLTVRQARAWSAAAPSSVIENLYGPTELTITCTAYRLPREGSSWPRTANGTVPIGRPYPHLEAIVRDEIGTPADEGELCVRGPQRFDGYLDADDNEGRFLDGRDGTTPVTRRPPTAADWYRTGDRVRRQDGELVHLERIDDQVKVNGYRIEIGEIEGALREVPGIRDVVVVAVGAEPGVRLHALYTGGPREADVLADHLRTRLPAYMVPVSFRPLERMPAGDTGKIDRGRLRELCRPAEGR